MLDKTNLLDHARAIHDCAPRFRIRAKLDLFNFRLTLTGRNRYYDLYPQFSAPGPDGGLRYVATLLPDVHGFIGWVPYINKRWPLAVDKLLFKEFCESSGLRTPRYWTQPEGSIGDFIVKPKFSSFSKGIRGPFRRLDTAESDHRLLANEYYEQFLPGTIAKAWYWEDRLACLEMLAMPSVTGDGRGAMYDLIVADMPKSRSAPDRSALAALARYQGVALDDVIPAGTGVIADFRYASAMFRKTSKNALPDYAGTEVGKQFSDAGPVLWGAIPEEIRAATLWTVDAIVWEDRVWFLEMNCNPAVHPDVYFPMLEALFGPPQAIPVPQEGPHPQGRTRGPAQAGSDLAPSALAVVGRAARPA